MRNLSKKKLGLILIAVIALLAILWFGSKFGNDSGVPSGTVAFETGVTETQEVKTTAAEVTAGEEMTSEAENPTSENAGESADDADHEEPAEPTSEETVTTAESAAETTVSEAAEETADLNAVTVAEDGEYNDKEHVALYIHLYGHLPSNYITKKQAEALGWVSSKKNLAEVAPGKSIGGSRFGNNEGLLPKKKGRQYYECDIDYVSGVRNAKRIVFSDDGLVFYTEDHYESFELLYE